MKWAGQVSKTARLAGQPRKMTNFICKVTWNRTSLLSPSAASQASGLTTFHIITINEGQPIEREGMLFWACANLEILRKKKHTSSKHVKM